MISGRPSPSAERRERGLALADDLLGSSRPLPPLSDVAHARVKRRLKASLRGGVARRPRWLQTVMIGGVMLVCGGAFGIAVDRLVLQRTPLVTPEAAPEPSMKQARRQKVKAAPAPGPTAPAADETAPAAEPPAAAPAAPSPTLSPSKAAASGGAHVPVALVPSPTPSGPARAPSVAPSPSPAPRSPTVPVKLAMRAEPPHPGPAQPAVPPAELPPAGPAVAPVVAAPAVVPVEVVAPAPAKVVPPVPQGLTEERLLAAALRALRAQHDPSSALLALEEYQTRFPNGRLAVEAGVLRVDALIALHRKGEALAALDRMDLGHVPGALERQLQRAELRVSAARWQAALGDFDKVLAQPHGQERDVAERALWGRAQTRAHLGDGAGARADADEYLRRFPSGRFAAQAGRVQRGEDVRAH